MRGHVDIIEHIDNERTERAKDPFRPANPLLREARDEIERLRTALKPFADALTDAENAEPTDPEARLLDCFHRLTLYEFSKARTAHGEKGNSDD